MAEINTYYNPPVQRPDNSKTRYTLTVDGTPVATLLGEEAAFDAVGGVIDNIDDWAEMVWAGFPYNPATGSYGRERLWRYGVAVEVWTVGSVWVTGDLKHAAWFRRSRFGLNSQVVVGGRPEHADPVDALRKQGWL